IETFFLFWYFSNLRYPLRCIRGYSLSYRTVYNIYRVIGDRIVGMWGGVEGEIHICGILERSGRVVV
ncbi:MAG: hypothetical protein N2746_03015, partial [Deltaproteobacteria bacterium]|nr:hypothetical protein [Deltaproteobacteria bacterium]